MQDVLRSRCKFVTLLAKYAQHPFLIFQKVGVAEREKCNRILVTKMNPSESEMTRTTPECKNFDSDNSGTPKLWQSYGKIWWSDHGPVVREAIRF